jgi:uncharacterized membrane protein YheB (UPF0754 family)
MAWSVTSAEPLLVISPPLLQAALTVAFASLAGGVTNTVAIWMLFHPYEPPRVGGRTLRLLQGAIPKNRERLASAMGRAVGERLLTGDDLAAALAEPTFRRAFEERLDTFLRAALEQERGSLEEVLPPAALAEIQPLLADLATAGLARLDGYLASDEFQEAARRWARDLLEEVRDRPIAELLTQEREEALTGLAGRVLAEALGGPGLERAIRDYLDRVSERLLVPDRTFEELLPVGLVAAVEKAVAGYLPLALERLAGLLEDPEAREQLRALLHRLLERFLQDLNFYKRVVATLVIPPDTVERVIRAMETEGAENLSGLLHDDAMRDAMARSVNEAIVDFLRRPVVSVLGTPDDPSVQEAKATIAGWAVAMAGAPQTGEFLMDKLRATLGAAEERTWGQLLGRVSPERVADALVAAARSAEAGRAYRQAADRVIRFVLARPIGRPADLLGDRAVDRVRAAVEDPLWRWLQDQVPAVAQRVDVAGKVERKILEYPMSRVEELVRSVTERELRLIVYLGYVLGAVIGLTLVAVQAVT